MNSRKSKPERLERTAAEIATEIRSFRKRDNDCVIAVEGHLDSVCYGRFINRSQAKILACGSKSKILKAVEILDGQGVSNVSSITDADYDHVLRLNPERVQTDYVDREAFLWRKRPEFEAQIESRFKASAFDESVTVSQIVDKAIVCAHCLGAARLSHDQTQISLGENTLSFKRFCFSKVPNIQNDQGIFDRIIEKVFDCNNLDSELKVHASRIRANYEQYTEQELCKGKDIIHAVITIVDALQFASKKLAQRENEIFVSVNGLFTTDFLRTCKTYLNFCLLYTSDAADE